MTQKKIPKRQLRSNDIHWWPLIAIGGLWVALMFTLKSSGLLLPTLFEATPTSRLDNGELSVLWNTPSLSCTNQNGQPMTDTEWHGHVQIINFIFTRCTTSCPLITAQMIMLQKMVQQPEVRDLSFSVDPTHDTPAVLKQYAANWKGDESRWQLLSLPRTDLYQLAASMKIAVLPVDNFNDQIIHSELFFLVDQQSRVPGVYRGSDATAMQQLAVDAVSLVGGKKSTVAVNAAHLSESENGERLFNTLGCTACHNQVRIAPPLAGVFGSPVKLNDGSTAMADDAYIREAILSPEAKIVAGYREIMPSYREYLSDDQITQLVTYLRTLDRSPADKKANSLVVAAQQPALTTATDPVCKMGVIVGDETPQAEYQEKMYHFCSDHCRQRFTQEPTKYTHPKKQS